MGIVMSPYDVWRALDAGLRAETVNMFLDALSKAKHTDADRFTRIEANLINVILAMERVRGGTKWPSWLFTEVFRK
jgi:hypothetical protein